MEQKNKASKTLPYTLIAASVIVLLILVAGKGSGKFSIGPLAIILFVVTILVVINAWRKRKSG